MDLGSTLGLALIMGLFGLVILVVLWPVEKNGRRLLDRWGVREPQADEVGHAVRYLRGRRLWYPWLYLALPLLPRATGFGSNTTGTVAGTLLLGALLAELFAQRPVRGDRRTAVLEHRGVLDFTPRWMLVVSGVLELAGAGYLVSRAQWIPLLVAAGAAAVSWAVLLLAIRRPATGTRRVDLALRCRSARVALGLGIGAVAAICWPAGNFGTFLAFVFSLAALIAIVSPPRRLPAIAVRPG